MSHYAGLPRTVALALPITLGAWTVQAADLIQTAEQVGRFDGFLQLVEAAGMVEVLKGSGPFTVFAPIDEAFSQLPPGALDWLLAEEALMSLAAIVQSHIVSGAAILEEDLLGRAVEVATLGGGTLALDGTTGFIFLVPIQAPTTVEAQAEQKSEALPVSVTVVEAPQRYVAGADRLLTRAEQELMGVALMVDPNIRADNGVIQGITILRSADR
jgi:hypothetical protein